VNKNVEKKTKKSKQDAQINGLHDLILNTKWIKLSSQIRNFFFLAV
jgi:hypothetical protein